MMSENPVCISLLSLLGFESLDYGLATAQQLTAGLWRVESLYVSNLTGGRLMGVFIFGSSNSQSDTRAGSRQHGDIVARAPLCAPGSWSKQLSCWTWMFPTNLQHSSGAGFECPSAFDCFLLSSGGFCVLRPCFTWSGRVPWTTAWYPVSFVSFLTCYLPFFSHSARALVRGSVCTSYL